LWKRTLDTIDDHHTADVDGDDALHRIPFVGSTVDRRDVVRNDDESVSRRIGRFGDDDVTSSGTIQRDAADEVLIGMDVDEE